MKEAMQNKFIETNRRENSAESDVKTYARAEMEFVSLDTTVQIVASGGGELYWHCCEGPCCGEDGYYYWIDDDGRCIQVP